MTDHRIYLNDGPDSFRGNNLTTAALRLAASFDLDPPQHSVSLSPVLITGVLEAIFEQLNVGGDLVPATDWTVAYRAAGNRSLSVGDVVVLGELAYAVERFGFRAVPTADLLAAPPRRGRRRPRRPLRARPPEVPAQRVAVRAGPALIGSRQLRSGPVRRSRQPATAG
jgi:hypothetical protein